VAGLEEMSRQLFLETVDLNRTLERIYYSKTLKGKYFNFLGYFFSIYCVWKIFIVSVDQINLIFLLCLQCTVLLVFKSSVNIIFDRVGKLDPVTHGIEIIVKYFNIDFDVQFWSQHISFLLVGIIVVTSIRGLLITLTKFFYAISSSNSSNIIVLVLAQIMV